MADDSALAAGIAAAGQAAAAYMSSNLNYKDSKKLMALQAQYQREQFDYTNDYNNPVNQIIRLRLAGLNPNLMYGHGQSVGNSAGMPQVSASRANFHDYSSVVARSIDAIRLIKEQRMVDQQIRNMSLQNEEQSLKNDILRGTKETQIQSIHQGLDNLFAQYQKMMWDADVSRQEAEIRGIMASQAKHENEIFNNLYQEGVIRDYLENKYENYWYQNSKLYQDIQKAIAETNKINLESIRTGHEIDVAAYRARLARSGVNPDEPYWGRILGQVAQIYANRAGYNDVSSAVVGGIDEALSKIQGWNELPGKTKGIIRAIAGVLSPGTSIITNLLSTE